jgi:hypothetical protein
MSQNRDIPSDLVRLSEVLEKTNGKPSRNFWDLRIARGEIRAYKVPGERGIFVSQAAVDEMLKPRPYGGPGESAEDAG